MFELQENTVTIYFSTALKCSRCDCHYIFKTIFKKKKMLRTLKFQLLSFSIFHQINLHVRALKFCNCNFQGNQDHTTHYTEC